MNINWARFTPKQRACLLEYLKTGKKVAAYRKVYSNDNHTSKTVWSNCARFFKVPHIKEAAEAIQAEAIRRMNLQTQKEIDSILEATDAERDSYIEDAVVNAQWVLKRAKMLADFNIKRFIKIDEVGNAVYDFSEADEDDWYCVQEYTTEILDKDEPVPTHKIKIKTHEKLRALELVGKHVEVQAFREQVALGNPDGTALNKMPDTEIDNRIRELLDERSIEDSGSEQGG